MHAGATVVFEQQFEAGATLDLLERERVTHVIGWPHIAKALTEHPTFPARDLGSIRGGSLDELLPEERRVGDPNLRANTLGMTESLGPHSLEVIGSALHPEAGLVRSERAGCRTPDRRPRHRSDVADG